MKAQRCPVCQEIHPQLIRTWDQDLDQPLLDTLRDEVPDWDPSMGVCARCLDQAHIEIQLKCLEGTGAPGELNGYKILPTPVRMMADQNYTGDGVTICMIDSGFVAHPDLVYPDNRILKAIDITQPGRNSIDLHTSANSAWHGTMTSVVCAGNGHLSGGIYRGLASNARLVLIKVTDANGAITRENIVKAIDWAIARAARYRIRIINLSVTDDEDTSYVHNAVDQAVSRAVRKGIVVVAAAGNDPGAGLKSPANAPDAITVGGLDDRNTLDPLTNTLYHSTFGTTVDAIHKPDIIAPAIWLPAPILPGSPEHREAQALYTLLATKTDASLHAALANLIGQTKLDRRLLTSETADIRTAIHQRIAHCKYISGHYQHADGTSFAAPIVCGVIAQMLEAHPNLDPPTIREILQITARRLPNASADRQGWGLVNPLHAVQMASGKPLAPLHGVLPVIDYKRMEIDFYLRTTGAREVVLTGDFLQWSKNGLYLRRNGDPDIWKATVPFQRKGVYRYKFLIDQEQWMADPRNSFREPDGFNDFNSKLIIT